TGEPTTIPTTEAHREAIPAGFTIAPTAPSVTAFAIASTKGQMIATTKPTVEASEIAFPEPSTKASEGRAEPYQTLEATHTGSEQKLYGFLYRETISKGKKVFQATQPYLRAKTGITGTNTLRRAIRGLHDKLSIRVLTDAHGDRAGTEYYVYPPKEIIASRKEAGIEIHPVTKDIRKRIATPSAVPSVEAFRARIGTGHAEGSTKRFANTSPVDLPRPSETAWHDKYIINPNGPDNTSSVPQQGTDDEKLSKVRKLFEQLSNGGQWKDDRDLKAYAEIAKVNLPHITLGLCYSVSRSPEHKMSSLAYAVPAILKHAEDMDEFSETTLEEIAYRTKRKTMNCIAEGKWTIPDWETGKE